MLHSHQVSEKEIVNVSESSSSANLRVIRCQVRPYYVENRGTGLRFTAFEVHGASARADPSAGDGDDRRARTEAVKTIERSQKKQAPFVRKSRRPRISRKRRHERQAPEARNQTGNDQRQRVSCAQVYEQHRGDKRGEPGRNRVPVSSDARWKPGSLPERVHHDPVG